MIDGWNFFNQLVKNNLITYCNIKKITAGHRDDQITGCLLDYNLLDYNYFNNYYKIISVDLSEQQALDIDPKAIQQINFTANLDRNADTAMFFIIEETKETILVVSQVTFKVLWILSYDLATACSTILFRFNMISIYNDSIKHFKRKII